MGKTRTTKRIRKESILIRGVCSVETLKVARAKRKEKRKKKWLSLRLVACFARKRRKITPFTKGLNSTRRDADARNAAGKIATSLQKRYARVSSLSSLHETDEGIERSILVLFSDESHLVDPSPCARRLFPKRGAPRWKFVLRRRLVSTSQIIPDIAMTDISIPRASFTGRADSRSSSTCCRAPTPCRAGCAPSDWCWSDCRDTS